MSNVNKDTIVKAINDPNFSFIDSFADANEPEKIRKEMTRLLFLHRNLRNQLRERERNKVIIQSKYDKKRRDSYMKHKNAPNERVRNVLVEIDTEKEKYDLDIIDQKIKELNRELSSIKIEIDTWKAIGYAIRTEMGAF